MFHKIDVRKLLIGLFLAAILLSPSLVSAGGWAVITLDQLPDSLVAGQPYTLGLMARQHGLTPWQTGELQIVARQLESGQVLTFVARPEGQPGHYQAELIFSSAGRWEWSVSSGLYPERQPMPTLEVAASQAAVGIGENGNLPATNPVAAVGLPAAAWLGFAMLALAAGVVFIARSKERRIAQRAGVGLILLFGVSIFAAYSAATANANVYEKPAESIPVTASAESTGQQLFLAKGCVVCHTNDRALQESAAYGVNMGPNLTDYRNDPDYLHAFLKDPQSMKPGTEMPNLELKKTEIEALIAFLNADGKITD